MNKDKFINLLNERILFLDGAYGTEFLKLGLKEKLFENLNITDPQVVRLLHKNYLNAGANIIITNTFSANILKLKSYNLAENFEKINEYGVKIAKSIAKDDALVFGDIGPTGVLLEPFGTLSFDEAYNIFKIQVKILIENGVDGIILETFTDIKELKSAICAVRDLDNQIPLIAQMTFQENGTTITGTSVEIFCSLINDLNVDVAGINCFLNPENILPILNQLIKFCNKYISIEPNAGNPKFQNGILTYDTDPLGFSLYSKEFAEIGANIIGGCCGTGPEHIKNIVKSIGKRRPAKRDICKTQFISSRTTLTSCEPFLVIGEKINASASKQVNSLIENKDLNGLISLAQNQADLGAKAIDINLGDEKNLSKDFIKDLILNFDRFSTIPLSLDIQDLELLEIALKEYPARAIVNSSTALKDDLEKHLKLIEKYGGMLVVLPMKKNLPKNAKSKNNIIKSVLKIIQTKNIERERIFFDPLITPIGVGNDYKTPLKIIEFLNKKNLKSIIGLSNLSFGFSQKEIINSSFLCLAMEKGLNSVICNCSHQITMKIVEGMLILKNKSMKKEDFKYDDPLINILLKGEEKLLLNYLNEQLKKFNPLFISENILAKYMQKIGKLYSDGTIFLPQLIISSETVQKAFDYLNNFIDEEEKVKKCKILMATVEGDIHDIGKKIVSTVLRASGYEVIDIGKNINYRTLYNAYKKIKPEIIGLSSMMTSTILKIKEISFYFKRMKVDVPILAGGASMNSELADEFGVYYAKDAVSTVRLCDQLISRKKKNEID